MDQLLVFDQILKSKPRLTEDFSFHSFLSPPTFPVNNNAELSILGDAAPADVQQAEHCRLPDWGDGGDAGVHRLLRQAQHRPLHQEGHRQGHRGGVQAAQRQERRHHQECSGH